MTLGRARSPAGRIALPGEARSVVFMSDLVDVWLLSRSAASAAASGRGASRHPRTRLLNHRLVSLLVGAVNIVGFLRHRQLAK